MLVVDLVELVAGDRPLEMRELQRDRAFGLQQPGDAGHEVVDVRHLGQDVVADDQVGRVAIVRERARQLFAEERDAGGHALGLGGRRNIGGGLDAENRDAHCFEMLQQVAVIAAQLDHLCRPVQRQPVAHGRAIVGSMLHPAVRERRKVGIIVEDSVGRYVLA